MLNKIEEIAFPCLLHSITPDGVDSMEDALDCIHLFLYHGSQKVSDNMWRLYP